MIDKKITIHIVIRGAGSLENETWYLSDALKYNLCIML